MTRSSCHSALPQRPELYVNRIPYLQVVRSSPHDATILASCVLRTICHAVAANFVNVSAAAQAVAALRHSGVMGDLWPRVRFGRQAADTKPSPHRRCAMTAEDSRAMASTREARITTLL